MPVHIYLHQIVIVNLSAFVLAGSHLVLSSTKAESIIGRQDETYYHGSISCCAGCFATILATKTRRHKGSCCATWGCHRFTRIFMLRRTQLAIPFSYADTKSQIKTKFLYLVPSCLCGYFLCLCSRHVCS